MGIVAARIRMAGLLDAVRDYSASGTTASLPVVWQL